MTQIHKEGEKFTHTCTCTSTSGFASTLTIKEVPSTPTPKPYWASVISLFENYSTVHAQYFQIISSCQAVTQEIIPSFF